MSRRQVLKVAIAAGCALIANTVFAQSDKPISLVLGYSAGGTTDFVARTVAVEMSKALGRQIIVDNVPGASGMLAAQKVSNAPADGSMIYLGGTDTVVIPMVNKKIKVNWEKDFQLLGRSSYVSMVMAVSIKSKYNTLQDLLTVARAKPGSLNFASAGQGSATHLNAEKFKMAAKIDATNIPFKGSAEAVTEVLAGRVDYYFSPIAPVIGQIRDGQLQALAVGSPKRAAALPEVPTTTEAGVPGSEFNFWIGMMAPAKTPREVVNRLHDEVAKALASPEVKDRFLKLGADAWTLKPEQFDAYIKDEITSNARLVKAAGLSPTP